MNQLCLILPLARRTDPETSHAAARRARALSMSHRNLIMAALRLDGPATVHEIERRTGIAAHAVGKRMVELQRLGLAKPSGRVIDGCRVWEVA